MEVGVSREVCGAGLDWRRWRVAEWREAVGRSSTEKVNYNVEASVMVRDTVVMSGQAAEEGEYTILS